MKIRVFLILTGLAAVSLSAQADDPTTCNENVKNPSQINFVLDDVNGHGYRAQREGTEWHLNDLDGGNIFFKKGGSKNEDQACVRANNTPDVCGDSLPKTNVTEVKNIKTCPGPDPRNSSKQSNDVHGTCLVWLDSSLYIFPLQQGSPNMIDLTKAFLQVTGSANTAKGTDPSTGSLNFTMHPRSDKVTGGTLYLSADSPPNSGTSAGISPTESLSAKAPENSQLGQTCNLGGLVNRNASLEKGKFTLSGKPTVTYSANNTQETETITPAKASQ